MTENPTQDTQSITEISLCRQFEDFLQKILIDKQSYLKVAPNPRQFSTQDLTDLVGRYVVNYIGSVGKNESSKHDENARKLLKAININDAKVGEKDLDGCGRVKKGAEIRKEQKEKIKNDLDFELRLREQFLNEPKIFDEDLPKINNEAVLLFANLMWLRYLPMSKKKINDNPESFGETAVNKIKNTLQLANIKLTNETLFNTNEYCVPYGQATIYIDNEMTDLVLLFNELAKWEITEDKGNFKVSHTPSNTTEQINIILSTEKNESKIFNLQINQQQKNAKEPKNNVRLEDVRLEFYKQFIIRWCLDLPLNEDGNKENEGVRSQAYKKVFEGEKRQRKAPAAPLPLHNMLLFICDPKHYDNISVTGDKKKIVETFNGLVDNKAYKECTFLDSGSFGTKNIAYNKYLYCIYQKIKTNMNSPQDVKIYDPEYKNLWSPDIDQLNNLKYKKAMMLYGPPGTSKTYTAKQLAKAIIFHSNYSTDYSNYKDDLGKGIIEKRIHRLQLHPNYTYEDFIWGYQIENEKYDPNGNIWQSGNKIQCVGSKTTPKKGYFLRLLDEIREENKTTLERITFLKETLKRYQALENLDNITDLLMKFSKCISDKLPKESDITKDQGKKHSLADNPFEDIDKEIAKQNDNNKEKESSGDDAKKDTTEQITINNKSVPEAIKDIKNRIFEEEKKLKVHVLILDEINRVDLSRLFGELFSAIENRNEPVDLTVKIDGLTSTNVNGMEVSQISVPENLYIIGTMNEIDFSLERVDFALRRRFVWEFYGFKAESLYSIIEFKSDNTTNLNSNVNKNTTLTQLEDYVNRCKKLNKAIDDHKDLGKQYEIGHTFFAEIIDIMKSGKNYKEAKTILWNISICPMLEAFLGNCDEKEKTAMLKKSSENAKNKETFADIFLGASVALPDEPEDGMSEEIKDSEED